MDYKLVKNEDWKEVEFNDEMKEIPSIWNVAKIKNIFNFKQGLQKSIEEQSLIKTDKSIRFIRIVDLTQKNEPKRYVENINDSHIISEKDLFMVRYGSPGLVGLGFKGVIANNLFRLIPKIEINVLFYKFLLLKNQNIIAKNSGSSTMPAINFSNLENVDLINISLAQQSSIASILSHQETIIQDIESLISKYESRFQYLSEELLSGKLRVKEIDGQTVLYKNPEDNWKEVEINGEMKDIPKDWDVEKLKKHILVINGYAFPKSHMLNEKTNNSVPIIKIGNIHDDTIIENSGTGQNYYNGISKDSFIPQYNDLIIGLSGANAGKTGIYKLLTKTVLNQRNAIVRIKSDVITQDFFNYFWFKDALETLRETTKDSAIPNISSEDIENIDVFIFSKVEQLKIAEILTEQKKLIIQQKEIFAKEKQKFNWLLDNLLSGKYLIKE